MALQQKAAAEALVAEFVEMLPPASSSLGNSDAELPPWIEEFVSARVLTASARSNMGWAVERILRTAAARCVHCSVDQLSCVVLPPIIQRIETTMAEREENQFDANQVRRAAMRAGAKMEGAKTPSRSKHFAQVESDLRRQLQELEQADSQHADVVEQLQPMRDFLEIFIRKRLEVDPARLQTDVDRIMALGLSGKDLSMEGSGTILHTAAEAGQADAIRGWLQLLAAGNDSDSDDDGSQLPNARSSPVDDEGYKGNRVAVVETSSPHFGNCGIVTSVSLRAGLLNIAFDDGTSSQLKSDHVRRHDQKTDAEMESERAYLFHAPGPMKYERLGAVHIDARSPNGATPLYAAAYTGHVDVVALLLQEKADVHAARDDGCTPMHAAARNGHIKVVEALVAGGADLSRPGKRGLTPLCMLVAGLQRAKLLAEAKDAEVVAFEQRTAEAQTMAGEPMNTEEFHSRQTLMKEKAEAWTKMANLEQTVRQFLEIGRLVQRVRRDAQHVFRKHDKDHSGHLSQTELNRMINSRVEKHRTDEDTGCLTDYTDRDGGIQWHQFWRWWWSQHNNGLWLPSTTRGKADTSDAMEFGYQAAFITESVEALWRDQFYTGMIQLLEGMVAQARNDAKSAEARALAESEERQEKEYARERAEWQKRMQAANAETRRKRTAVWRTSAGQELLNTLQDAQAAQLISEQEVGKLKLKVQSGIIGAVELERAWKRKWLLHCTHKGIASANSAPLITKRKTRQPVLPKPRSESSNSEENLRSSAPWFDVDRCMFGALPVVTLQVGLHPSRPAGGYDRRRILTKGVLYLVGELQSHSSNNRALALWALAVLCGPNTTEGIKFRRMVLGVKTAVKQIVSLVMRRGVRQSEVILSGPALLATLIYEDKSVASIVQSTGCIAALVHLIELKQRVEILTSVLCCLVNLAVDSTCRRECCRLELARLVRPLCLEQTEVGSIGLILLKCLHEHSQLDQGASKKKADKEILNSPEVQQFWRETQSSSHGSSSFPSVRTPDSTTSAIITSAKQSDLEELTAELPFLIRDFPRVDPYDIRRICESAGGITETALTRLTALNQEEQVPQKINADSTGKPDAGLAVNKTETEVVSVQIQSQNAENGESAWATDSFAAFGFVENLQAVKPTPKMMIPGRPLHMLGSLFGHSATKHDLEETFNAFDADGDGVLNKDELKNGLLSLGVKLSSEEIEGVMAVLDADGNGEIDSREFCHQFQRWTGGQLSDEEQRTMQWHSKPTALARRSEIQTLRKGHCIKPSIDADLADDHIDRLSQAIIAERDARLAKVVAKDRKRIRAAVTQVQKVYRRSDELVELSEMARDTTLKDVEDARRAVRLYSKQQQKLLSEIQHAKDKMVNLVAAASHGGFVHKVDFTHPAGTPTVSKRWLELARGELVWRFGHEQLLDEAAAVSRSITQPQEPKPTPSALSTKTGNKMQLVVEGTGDESVPGWVSEAREKLQSEKDEIALSPLQSPLSSHKSFSRLSPLVSPAVRSTPKHVTNLLSPSSIRSGKSLESRRRRVDIASSWDSPLRGPGSNPDVLSLAELALSTVAQGQTALTCCTETDANEYIETRELRERLRKSAREADRPMPRFDSLVLKTAQYSQSQVVEVILGAPDSTGNSSYTFIVSDETELEKWKVALKAGIQFSSQFSYWEERLRHLQAKSIEATGRVAVYRRGLAKAEQELEKADITTEQIQDASARADDLAQWSVMNELARTTRNQALLKAEKLTDVLQNWPGLVGPQRVASMLLTDGQSVH